MRTNLIAVVMVSAILLTGYVIFSQSRTSSLVDFSSAQAQITRLDWILLKAEVATMRDRLSVKDVGWPSYQYDRIQNQLTAHVFVNNVWWESTDAKTAKDTLRTSGSLYCFSPYFEDNQLRKLVESKTTGCRVDTFAGSTNRTVLATFFADRDEVVLK